MRWKVKPQHVSAQLVCCLLLSVPAAAQSDNGISFSSNVLLTADKVNPFYVKQASSTHTRFELRRGKLAMDWQVIDGLSTEIELNIQQEYQQDMQYEWADVNVQYQFSSKLNATLGRMKMPFSLESQISSAKSATIERSLLYDAFMPSRAMGGLLNYYHKNHKYGLAVAYYDDIDDNIQGLTARATQQFKVGAAKLHLGLTVRHDDLNDQRYQIKLNGEINSAHSIIRSPRFYASQQMLVQTEMAFINGATLIHGQLVRSDVRQVNTPLSPGKIWYYGGISLQLSHFLGGGEYRYKKGKVSQDYQAGAWWVVARYSGIDLDDYGLGSAASSFTLGANHALSQAVTFMAEVKIAQISGNTLNTQSQGYGASFALRFTL